MFHLDDDRGVVDRAGVDALRRRRGGRVPSPDVERPVKVRSVVSALGGLGAEPPAEGQRLSPDPPSTTCWSSSARATVSWCGGWTGSAGAA